MAEIHNSGLRSLSVADARRIPGSVHPAWLQLIHYCSELGHGQIDKLKIQDGLPVLAEVTTKKVKFSG